MIKSSNANNGYPLWVMISDKYIIEGEGSEKDTF